MYQVVVIDDDVNTSCAFLKQFPWQENGLIIGKTLENGRERSQYPQENTVDLIVSDIKMSEMNEIELASELHQCRRAEKAFLISGCKDLEYAQKVIERGVRYYCVKPINSSQLKSVLEKIREELDDECTAESHPQPDLSADDDSQILRIRSYIMANYRTVTLMELADYMQMNTSYLSHVFKDKTGMCLRDEITAVRMKKASELLKEDYSASVEQIAEKVGYSNAVSFVRAFRKHFGVSPVSYRKNANGAST